MTNAVLSKYDLNIYPDSTTEQMAKHLRAWADCEERYGARARAAQWRAVAARLDELRCAHEARVTNSSQHDGEAK